MLAHQGGWDEILLVLGPILVIGGLLYLAKKRVSAVQPTEPVSEADPASAEPDAPEGEQSA
jgi:hypothetical protein